MGEQFEVPPLGDMVVADLLERQARTAPSRRFVSYEDSTWTYRQVQDAAVRLAAGLRAIGVARGDYVGLFLPNGPEFVNTYFAMSRMGAVMVPVNTGYRGAILEYLFQDTGCEHAVVHRDYLERLREAEDALPRLRTIVVVGADASELDAEQKAFARVRLLPFSDLERDPAAGAPAEDGGVAVGDVNCIIYTSGTTGPSKGVPITNGHAVHKAIEVLRICDVTGDDVVYSPLPLFHSMALLRGVVCVMLVGGAIVLRERFSASRFWDDVREQGATVGHCVFSIPKILQKAPPGPRDRDHPLRSLYNASHDPDFEERFGVRLIEGYGLTEAGVAMYNRAGEPTRPGSCGRLAEDWEVRLVDDLGAEVGVDEVGEIALRPLRPYMVTPGYHHKPEATVEAFRHLWFHTGDLATRDADGFYYFKDRKKDAIRRRGENISSWEVERVLVDHPAVLEAAAVPYPSDLGEDDLRVVIALREGQSLTAEELLAYCERRMPDFMVPRYVEFRAELPKTPTGRLEKYRLREEGLGPDCHDRGDTRRASRR